MNPAFRGLCSSACLVIRTFGRPLALCRTCVIEAERRRLERKVRRP